MSSFVCRSCNTVFKKKFSMERHNCVGGGEHIMSHIPSSKRSGPSSKIFGTEESIVFPMNIHTLGSNDSSEEGR